MKRLVALLVGATLAAGVEAAPLSDYTGAVFFGDSLSDAGNLFNATSGNPALGIVAPALPPGSPPGPGYYQGRFSNGPIWADIIAAEFAGLGRPSANAAFGYSGAITNNDTPTDEKVPDLAEQIAGASPLLPFLGARPLASVWTGSNDVFRYVESGGLKPTPEAAAAAVIAGIASLVAQGVEDILTFTLPDFGLIPRFAMFQPGLVDEASAAAARFNAAFLAALPTIAGANIETVRMDRLFTRLSRDPGAYGITEFDAPCIMPTLPFFTPIIPSPPPQSICPDPTGYAFFDANHPSATLQAAIASEVERALVAPIPLPATLPLAASGIAALLAIRRRRG